MATMATDHFKASTEQVRKVAPHVGEVERWRCFAQAAWIGVGGMGSVDRIELGDPRPVLDSARDRSPDPGRSPLSPAVATAFSPQEMMEEEDFPSPTTSAPSYASAPLDSPRIPSSIGGPRPAPINSARQQRVTSPYEVDRPPMQRPTVEAYPAPAGLYPTHPLPSTDSRIPYPIEGRSPTRPSPSPRHDTSQTLVNPIQPPQKANYDSRSGFPSESSDSSSGAEMDRGQTYLSSPEMERNEPRTPLSPSAYDHPRPSPGLDGRKRVQISRDQPEVVRQEDVEGRRGGAGDDDEEGYFDQTIGRSSIERERDHWAVERARIVAEMEEQDQRILERQRQTEMESREREGQRVREIKNRLDNGSHRVSALLPCRLAWV